MKKKNNSNKTSKSLSVSGLSILGSSIKTPEAQVEETKRELVKYGVQPNESVVVEDPFTGKKITVSLNRTGHNEKNLIKALADPELTRDRKDHALSMYLYERGAQSSSMIVDLMRYKGQHTKESRVFQSRVQYDFQSFVDSFTSYLENQSRLLGATIGKNIQEEKIAFENWLKLPNNKGKGYTYKNFVENGKIPKIPKSQIALVEMAIHSLDEAQRLRKAIRNIAQARDIQKGGGIYVDRQGRPYSVNDENLDKIIKADREIQSEAEKNTSSEGL